MLAEPFFNTLTMPNGPGAPRPPIDDPPPDGPGPDPAPIPPEPGAPPEPID